MTEDAGHQWTQWPGASPQESYGSEGSMSGVSLMPLCT